MNTTLFQYCQKIVVLSKDKTKVLLCKRKGEADYDGVFSFIGGKMETTDTSIIEGIRREKNEEVGIDFKIQLLSTYSMNMLFHKSDGNAMILPHYLGIHEEGDIQLNEEYSEYMWVHMDSLEAFEPKIPNIPDVIQGLLPLINFVQDTSYVII